MHAASRIELDMVLDSRQGDYFSLCLHWPFSDGGRLWY